MLSITYDWQHLVIFACIVFSQVTTWRKSTDLSLITKLTKHPRRLLVLLKCHWAKAASPIWWWLNLKCPALEQLWWMNGPCQARLQGRLDLWFSVLPESLTHSSCKFLFLSRLTFDPRLIRLLARPPSTLMVRFFPSKSNSTLCCLSSSSTA